MMRGMLRWGGCEVPLFLFLFFVSWRLLLLLLSLTPSIYIYISADEEKHKKKLKKAAGHTKQSPKHVGIYLAFPGISSFCRPLCCSADLGCVDVIYILGSRFFRSQPSRNRESVVVFFDFSVRKFPFSSLPFPLIFFPRTNRGSRLH